MAFPSFEDLPFDKNGPRGNAWGVWGPGDEIGTLNHLTDAVVLRAAQEQIVTGQRISLNWALDAASFPCIQHPRKQLQVTLINKEPRVAAHDDEWSFNTQCSSQWDGCRHYAYQTERLYYGGRTSEDFVRSSSEGGIQHMAQRGISGRGVLIDWYRWASKQKSAKIDAMSAYAIPLAELKQAALQQGTPLEDLQPGDILIVRSGYISQYMAMDHERRESLDALYRKQKPENIGVAPSKELLELLWNKKVAAVAGDARSFEVWPCTNQEYQLHQWLLAGWAMPIGELFDLEALSEACEAYGRNTFFFTSAPNNVPGGVASPPNALAFF